MSDVLPINGDWQSSGNLSDSLWYMHQKQIMCDVVFEVGKDYERIGAHTPVLAARSDVFFKQFTKALPIQLEIELEDVNPKHFRLFLRYLYTGQVTIDNSDNEAVLAIAEKYQVTRLTELIVAETLSTMTSEKFCAFVLKYDTFSADIQARCQRHAFATAVNLFNCPQFVDLPYMFLSDVIGHEYLELEEEAICTAMLLWATKACENNNMVVNGENQRKVLKDLIYLIRFPLLSQDFFTENISEKELLTPTEEVQLLKFFLNSKSVLKSSFKKDKRKAPKEPFSLDSHRQSPPSLSLTSVTGSLPNNNTRPDGASNTDQTGTSKASSPITSPPPTKTLTLRSKEVMRFHQQGQGWGYRGNKKDAVAFISSKDIRLESVFVYGSNKESKLDVSVTIKDDKDVTHTTTTQIENTKAQSKYEIPLDRYITIKANATYHIIITLSTDTGFYGKGGRSSLNVEDVSINFMRSKFSTNNTTESIGQIPGFRFTKL